MIELGKARDLIRHSLQYFIAQNSH